MNHKDTFRRIPWSLTHCCIALGGIAIFRAVFHVLSLVLPHGSAYSKGTALWVLVYALWMSMFGWMVIFPLWIAHSKGMLRRPAVGRALKELGLAVPLVFCLLLVEWLLVVALRHLPVSPVDLGSALSEVRGAPNTAGLYLLLVVMFTVGPFAEELFFRGLLYNALRQRIAPLGAMVLQAMAFALVHYRCPDTRITNLIVVFALGIVMAGLYEWRKTLWSPIAVHALKNFAFTVPIILLMILNSHTPAKTWLEAELPPDWLETDHTGIERKATGEEQRLHAINTWGSKGLRMWKEELRAFQAVCEWFPHDRKACAKSRLGMAMIYRVYLRDLRRAVVESNRILSEFRDQPESCAEALVTRGWAYYELGDYQKARESFQEVFDSYQSYEWVRAAALDGLRVLDRK